MARYVWRNGDFVDGDGKPMEIPKRNGVQAPMVMVVNFDPYKSCVTGKVVDGQRSRREELAEAKDKGFVPFERIDAHPGGCINPDFCKKGGRKVSEAATEWAANKRKATAVKTDASGAILAE